MKSTKYWKTNGLFVFLILVLFANTSCSVFKSSERTRSSKQIHKTHALLESPSDVWRPTKTHTIPVVMNTQVRKWVDLFNGRFRSSFQKWVHRLGLYAPTIENVLLSEGVPKDLIYLAMIESGFNLKAYSRAAAAGPWQFMRSTGRLYDLHSDFFADDRNDLVTSTRAAARHLKDLYNIYGDWYLSFAAYNAGGGKINRAIRGTGSKDYWKLARSRYIRRETKEYVPKILAALHIVKNYTKYGYSSRDFGEPLQFEQVIVPDATDITVIAKSAGTNVETIRELNPALTSGITRPDQKTTVYIPKGKKSLFEKRYSTIPENKRVQNLYHNVERGENVHSIASLYGISTSELARENNVSTNQKLSPGQSLRIPADKKVLLAMAGNSPNLSSGDTVYYRVKRGDTLSRIAKKFRAKPSHIARLNHIHLNSKLRVGQRLKVQQRFAGKAPSRALYIASAQQPVETSSSRSNKRLSGVAHIILDDQTLGTRLQSSTKEDSFFYVEAEEESPDLSGLIAMADDLNSSAEETPSIVRLTEKESQNQKPKYHLVKRGETLWSLSKRYGVTVSEIKKWNKMTSSRIQANQKLKILNEKTEENVAL